MEKPKPVPTAETLPYWLGAGAGELRYTYCARCETPLFPPRSLCTPCRTDTEWRTASGSGAVHAFTRVERAPSAAFRADTPYTIALIDLDEGFRILTNLRGPDIDGVGIGDRVSILFEPIADEPDWGLPQARLNSASTMAAPAVMRTPT